MSRLNRYLPLIGLLAACGGLSLLAAGCHDDRPHAYGEDRPAVGDITPGDGGLQSKEVIEASEKAASSLLAMDVINRSPTRVTIVITDMENHTTNPGFEYQIFLERLRTVIAQNGSDRIALIENKATLGRMRNNELDTGVNDSRIQAQYGLYGRISELPNRATSYYLCEFTLTNLKTGEQMPLKPFEVKVAR